MAVRATDTSLVAPRPTPLMRLGVGVPFLFTMKVTPTLLAQAKSVVKLICCSAWSVTVPKLFSAEVREAVVMDEEPPTTALAMAGVAALASVATMSR